jgi:hypothetical protein
LRVPSIDPRINQCLALVGQTAIDCWAYLDKYVNTRIIPWVPLAFGQVTEVGARRLAGVPIDPFTARPAVEQMRGEPDARAPPGMAHPPLKCVPSPVPLGSYVKTIRRGDVAPSDSFSEGTWSWNVGPPDSNCVYRSTFFEARNGIVSFEDIHPFTVPERGVIELHGSGEVAARYRITRRGKAVRATDITPDPGGRQVIMTTNPWIRG